MAKIKLTKTAVESAQPQAKDIELGDTAAPGFLCKSSTGTSSRCWAARRCMT